MNQYKKLFKFVFPHLGVMALAMVFMVLSSIVGSAPLGMIIPLIDRIFSGKGIVLPQGANAPSFVIHFIEKINSLSGMQLLNLIIFWALGLMLLNSIFTFFQTWLMKDFSQKVIRDIRAAMYNKLINLSLDFYSRSNTGKLASRIIYDAGTIQDSITEGLSSMLYEPIQLVVYFALALAVRAYFQIPWSLVLIIFAVLPMIIYPVVRIGKKIRKLTVATQDKMADLNSAVYETLSGIRIVKAFAMENYEKDKFSNFNASYYKMMMKSFKRTLAITPIIEIAYTACALTVLWLGGKAVITGGLSAGAFMTFMASLLCVIKPFKKLSKLHSISQQAMAASTRIFEIIDELPTITDKPDAIEIAPIKNSVVFNNVSFKYEQKVILHNIKFKAQAGQMVAIVGPTGSGKTTFVNLIPRFYDPFEGNVEIDSVDIKNVKLMSLIGQIGMVTQETILFNDTVGANISYGKKEDRNKIIEAAKIANAHDFIIRLPKGYDTIIGERGFKLSGGEKQRLAIARAVLKNPPILILDEATSQLDSENEKLVQEALDRLMSGRTSFVIAHRLSTVRNAAIILVMDKGRIVESGTHDELVNKDGLYKRLYQMQFRDVTLSDPQ